MKIIYIGRNKDLECHICHRTQIESIISIKNELEPLIKENIAIKDKIQNEFTKFGYFSDIYFFNKFGESLNPDPFDFSIKLENYLYERNYPETLTEEALQFLYTPSLRFLPANGFQQSSGNIEDISFNEFVDLLTKSYIIFTRTYVCYICSEMLNIVDQNSFGEWFRYIR